MPAGAEARCSSPRRRSSRPRRAPRPATRVAFIYYVLGLDMDARRVADTWRQGATGEWASQAAWVSGLASWRLGDYNAASTAFQQVAQLADQRELRAGGLLLGGARRAGGGPARVGRAAAEGRGHDRRSAGKLLRAARARDARHVDQARAAIRSSRFDPPVDQYPNVQRAIELARIGEPGARRGNASPPGEDRRAVRASRADPARQAARPSRGPAVARQIRPVWRPLRRRPTAIPTRAGARSTAGASIPPSPSATSSRNPRSAAPRSAPPARSA